MSTRFRVSNCNTVPAPQWPSTHGNPPLNDPTNGCHTHTCRACYATPATHVQLYARVNAYLAAPLEALGAVRVESEHGIRVLDGGLGLLQLDVSFCAQRERPTGKRQHTPCARNQTVRLVIWGQSNLGNARQNGGRQHPSEGRVLRRLVAPARVFCAYCTAFSGHQI